MNEPFDAELGRAVKESAGKALDGWEFTPAMRARVLAQARAEAGEPAAPAGPPSRRYSPGKLTRPAAWIAVAAAAAAIALNTDLLSLKGMGSAKKETAQSTASAPAPAATADPKSPTPEFTVTSRVEKGEDSKPAAGQQPESTKATLTAVPVPPDSAPQQGPRTFELQQPTQLADAASAADAPPVTLFAKSAAAPKIGIASVAPANMAGSVNANGAVVAVTESAVKLTDASNFTVWEVPLPGVAPNARVAAAPDGRVAVAGGGTEIAMVNDRGELERTLTAQGPVNQLAWSFDGRLAVATAGEVALYAGESGKLQAAVATGGPAAIAFAPDGLLAAVTGEQLILVDGKGTLAAKVKVPAVGQGIAVASGGRVVVAGAQAYDRAGKPLWRLPLQPDGVAALGADRVLAWDAHQVLAANAADGRQIVWQAGWKGAGPGITRVVPAPDGRFTAILAQVEDGALLWVVGADGRQIYAEKLPAMPVEVGIAGNQLVLIHSDKIEYRTVSAE